MKRSIAIASLLVLTQDNVHGFSPIHPSTTSRLSSMPTELQAFDVASSFNGVESFMHSQPYLSAFLTCSVQNSAADLISQKAQTSNEAPTAYQEQKDLVPNFDVRRNLGFLLYGGFYGGMWQNYMYNTVFPLWFGRDQELWTVVREVATDMFLMTPLLCLPTLYIIKAIVSDETIPSALAKYKDNVVNDNLLLKNWAVWLPVQTINFAIIPAEFRIPFNAFVSFIWVIILSTITSTKEEEQSVNTMNN